MVKVKPGPSCWQTVLSVVCVVETFHSVWRCAWCLCIEFILFLCKSEVWTSITWQWKWNTTSKVFVGPRHIFLYICDQVSCPNTLPERRSVILFAELHHNYIILSEFGIATDRVMNSLDYIPSSSPWSSPSTSACLSNSLLCTRHCKL